MIAAPSLAAQQLSDWLQEAGWEPMDRLLADWSLAMSEGECLLKRLHASSQSAWAEWILESPHLPVPGSVFSANHRIDGPWKFITSATGEIRCRGDLPRETFVTDDSFNLITGKASSPLECWVEITTAIAKGSAASAKLGKPATEHLVQWLKEHGHVASADGPSARVTVPLAGTFREVAIDWQESGMVRLTTEIGRLENWPEPSVEAAEDFLHEANRRLRLVRIARPGEEKLFSMEACFCAPGPGVWLQSAVNAFCTGMALVVSPLAALRDPGVADMLLAGRSAKDEGGAR